MTLSATSIPTNVNDAQWKAINHDDGHLLIIAGPGTGKTHTLTLRIARIARNLAESQQILAITFTNKAALEMEARLKGQIRTRNENIFVGTFHSFCRQFLRQFIDQTDLPKDFQVATPEEIADRTKSLWPGLSKAKRSEKLEKISQYKSIHFNDEMDDEIVEYNRVLRQNSLLDFDDLLLETVKLLQNNKDVLKQVQGSFRYVFVDEYQDINFVQHTLLTLLVREDVTLTAIGDPNQAIYGFRGGDLRFFQSFSTDFPGATILSLQENYRSAQNLLTASGQVIRKNKTAIVDELVAKIYTQGKLTIHESPTDKAEAEYVVHQIETMVGGTSMFSQDSGRVETHKDSERSFGDMAILYRLNSQRNLLKTALERSGIPFQIAGQKSLETELLSNDQDKYIERTEKVSLMTMHAAKGLEFPVVFIVGCEDKLLPLQLEGFNSNVDEERRLFYVAMTRAKERLFLVHAKRRFTFGKTYQNDPSPFLSDIEESLKSYERSTKLPSKKSKAKQQMTLFKL